MYVIKPLIVTSGIGSYHIAIRRRVIEIMDEEAARESLQWDQNKDSQLYVNSRGLETSKTLGLTIDNRFRFDAYIKNRTRKALAAYQTMSRLQNCNYGITRKSSGSLYAGMIGPIFTHASEISHRPCKVQCYD